MRRLFYLVLFAFSIQFSCEKTSSPNFLFERIKSEHSKITFENTLTETNELNYFTYPYMYFGGGVAAADLNNDGLPEIIATGNMMPSEIYENKGNLVFNNITRSSGIYTNDRWVTGVSIADINNDGLLDIYFCVSGKDVTGANPLFTRENLLYINNGDLTFTEKAKEYGLNINTMSVQAAFFDLDNDGDLDMYLANYPEAKLNSTNDFWNNKIANPSFDESDRLFVNENGSFIDKTVEFGVLNYGLSLGVVISDINKDGFSDIYVSNDFNTPDLLLINNGDGSFAEEVRKYTQQTSNYGMGIDVGDFNNDGFQDFYQLDMMPEFNYDKKTNMGAMNHQEFLKCVEYGFHYQYMHNAFQLNNGNGTFSQISQQANVAETDWSWSTVIADFDNDSNRDIFITNGLRRSVNNNDFNNFLYENSLNRSVSNQNILEFVKKIPEEPKANYAFKNTGDLSFTDTSEEWGLNFSGYSNGSTYADLDDDGDLEILVNNIDEPLHIYKNNSDVGTSKSMRVSLRGKNDNFFGIGASVELFGPDFYQFAEMQTVHGFQSSTEPVLHFGLGSALVEKVVVTWPSGLNEVFLVSSEENNFILTQGEGQSNDSERGRVFDQLNIVSNPSELKHLENNFDDFEYQYFLPFKVSQTGPALSVGDVNGDLIEDVFIGNGAGFASTLFLSDGSGFVESNRALLEKDKDQEDVNAIFFDMENDGDLDLAVITGGNEFEEGSENYLDRLYVNDGSGNFHKSALSNVRCSGSSITSLDYNGDSLMDLFITGYLIPRKYPKPASSYLLKNMGNGEFKVDNQNGIFNELGNSKKVISSDVNNDGEEDLIVVGEWMPIKIFLNNDGVFSLSENETLDKLFGWWNTIAEVDLDGNEFPDFVVGNVGLNYKYQATSKKPFRGYLRDFDTDGDEDFILTIEENGREFPIRGRRDFVDQFVEFERRFPDHVSFANASIDMLFPNGELDSAYKVMSNENRSIVIKNYGGDMEISYLPKIAQTSSINSITLHDFDKDGIEDMFIGGNLLQSEVETPRLDASYGFILFKRNGHFVYEPTLVTNLGIKGEVKSSSKIQFNGQKYLMIGVNNSEFEFVTLK